MATQPATPEKAPTLTLDEALSQGLIERPDYSPLIKAGIEDGSIVEELKYVNVKAPEGKADVSQPYIKLVARTLDGAQAITGKEGDEAIAEVCENFTYGWDLYVRSLVRSRAQTQMEGPEKAIDRAAADMVKAGMYDTIGEARAFVIERRKARGEAV